MEEKPIILAPHIPRYYIDGVSISIYYAYEERLLKKNISRITGRKTWSEKFQEKFNLLFPKK